jgi:hypothetical protein
MDNPQPTAAGGRLDHDPAANSIPAVHPSDSAPIPSAIGTATKTGTDRATRRALLLCATALERHDKTEVLGVLGALLAGMPIAEVLIALENLAGSRAGGGEQS